jgi:clan AA aspartic protease
MSSEAPPQKGRVRQVGMVRVNLTIANHRDEIAAEEGRITANQVRLIALTNVTVDTGATTLCLPADVIAHLGLPLLDEIDVRTATSRSRLRLFDDATITVLGRKATFDCVEVPEGSAPLLGVIPLERLGFDPDLQNQTLRPVPADQQFFIL